MQFKSLKNRFLTYFSVFLFFLAAAGLVSLGLFRQNIKHINHSLSGSQAITFIHDRIHHLLLTNGYLVTKAFSRVNFVDQESVTEIKADYQENLKELEFYTLLMTWGFKSEFLKPYTRTRGYQEWQELRKKYGLHLENLSPEMIQISGLIYVYIDAYSRYTWDALDINIKEQLKKQGRYQEKNEILDFETKVNFVSGKQKLYQKRVVGLLQKLKNQVFTHTHQKRKIILENSQSNLRLVFFALILAFIVILLFGSITTEKFIIQPIQKMVKSFQKIAKGNFKEKVENNRADELGALIEAFNLMAKNLSQTTVSSEYFDQIICSIPGMLAVTDENGFIQKVNLAFYKKIKLCQKHVIGKNLTEFIKDNDGQKIIDHAKQTGSIYNFETSYSAKDSSIPVTVSGSTVKARQSQSGTSLAFIALDISEKRKLEKDKAEIHKQLVQSQKLEAIGQLAGGVAHDFNNLLGGILGYASMLKPKIQEPNQKKYLDFIVSSAKRAAELTQKLLGFARKGKYENKPMNLNNMIQESLLLIEKLSQNKIKIKVDLDQNLGLISGDSTQLMQVVMNLGVNAKDAMPTGGTLTFQTKNVNVDKSLAKW